MTSGCLLLQLLLKLLLLGVLRRRCFLIALLSKAELALGYVQNRLRCDVYVITEFLLLSGGARNRSNFLGGFFQRLHDIAHPANELLVWFL